MDNIPDRLITINLSYYNQPKEILMRHIDSWKTYPNEIKNRFSFIIIDDCSKIPISNIIDKTDLIGLNIKLYRVKKDLYCNIAGVRNLGAQESKTPWLLILDMDTLVDRTMAEKLVTLGETYLNDSKVFKFNRIVKDFPNHIKNNKIHPAIALIRKKDYWNIGGCEEDLVGNYGYTDPSFWHRVMGKVSIVIKKDIYLNYILEGEADINRNTEHNKKLFNQKKKLGNWSNDFIRFDWDEIIL